MLGDPGFRAAILLPPAGFDAEFDALAFDVIPKLSQSVEAHGLQAQIDILTGYGGSREDSMASWAFARKEIAHRAASDPYFCAIIVTGDYWGDLVPPFHIPSGDIKRYHQATLAKYYQIDSRTSTFVLMNRDKINVAEVAEELESPPGLYQVMHACAGNEGAFWISRSVPNSASALQSKWPHQDRSRISQKALEASKRATEWALSEWPEHRAQHFSVKQSSSETGDAEEEDLAAYLSSFSSFITEHLRSRAEQAMQHAKAAFGSKPRALSLHHRFLDERALTLPTREDIVDELVRFSQFSHSMEGSPLASAFLVLHGPPCSGKSTAVARAISAAKTALEGAVVVPRFIGIGSGSKRVTLRQLMHSINRDLSSRYQKEASEHVAALRHRIQEAKETHDKALAKHGAASTAAQRAQENLNILHAELASYQCDSDQMGPATEQFHQRLRYASKERPLLLAFCGLDNLHENDVSDIFHWLPDNVPQHVRILISASAGPVLDALKAKILDPFCFTEITPLSYFDHTSMLGRFTERVHLTSPQLHLAEKLMKGAKHPLFSNVLLGIAEWWLAVDTPDTLKRSIPKPTSNIENLFTSMLHIACECFPSEDIVHRVLAYVTYFSQHPLTETELMHLCSLDDILLDAVMQHDRIRPAGRFPVCLWLEIKNRLAGLLVVSKDGYINWCHGIVVKAARSHILLPIKHNVMSIAAEYLSGRYAAEPKPLVLSSETCRLYDTTPDAPVRRGVPALNHIYLNDDSNEQGESGAPLLRSRIVNRRSVNSSLQTFARIGDWKHAISNFMCNFEWLHAVCATTTIMDFVDMIRSVYSPQTATNVVRETIDSLSATLTCISADAQRSALIPLGDSSPRFGVSSADDVDLPQLTISQQALARQLLAHLPASNLPLRMLRHQAELVVSREDGQLWCEAPLATVPEFDCVSLLRIPGWKCMWAGLGQGQAASANPWVVSGSGKSQQRSSLLDVQDDSISRKQQQQHQKNSNSRSAGRKSTASSTGRSTTRSGARKGRRGRSDLHLVLMAWLSAGGRDQVRVFDMHTGILLFQHDLEELPCSEINSTPVRPDPIQSSDHPAPVTETALTSSSRVSPVVGMRIGDNLRGVCVWRNGTVKVWLLPAGDELLEFQSIEGTTALGLSRDGNFLLTASDTAYAVWDTANGRPVISEQNMRSIVDATISENGSTIVILTRLDGLLLIDLKSGSRTRFPLDPSEPAVSVAVDATGRKQVTVSYECEAVKTYDVRSRKAVLAYSQPGRIAQLKVSYHGWCASIASGGNAEGVIHMQHIATSESQLFSGHEGKVNSIQFHPVLRDCLLSAGSDGTIRTWHSPSSRKALQTAQLSHQHFDAVDHVCMNSTFIISAASSRPVVHLWGHDGTWKQMLDYTNADYEETGRLSTLASPIVLSTSQSVVATTTSDGVLHCFNLSTLKSIAFNIPHARHSCAVVGADGMDVVACASGSALHLLDPTNATELGRVELPSHVAALAAHPHSHWIVCVCAAQYCVVDAISASVVAEHKRTAFAGAVSLPSTPLRGVGSDHKNISCEDSVESADTSQCSGRSSERGESPPPLVIHLLLKDADTPWFCVKEAGDSAITFAPAVHGDGELDSSSTAVATPLQAHIDDVSATCVCNQGRYLCVATRTGCMFVWDMANEELVVSETRGVEHAIVHCVFSSASTRLLTVDDKGTVRNWACTFREGGGVRGNGNNGSGNGNGNGRGRGVQLLGQETCMSAVAAISTHEEHIATGLANGLVGVLSMCRPPAEEIRFGENSLYNVMDTVQRFHKSKAKAKKRPFSKKETSEDFDLRVSSTRQLVNLDVGEGRRGRRSGNTSSSSEKSCCTIS